MIQFLSFKLFLGIDCNLDELVDEMTLEENESLFEKHVHREEAIKRGNTLRIQFSDYVPASNLQYYRLIKPLKGFCH